MKCSSSPVFLQLAVSQRMVDLSMKGTLRISSVLSSAVVVEEYTSTRDSELTIKKGEHIEVMNKYDNGWWLGEVGGKLGLFPSKCVTESTTESAPTSTLTSTPSESPTILENSSDVSTRAEKRFTYPHSSRSEKAIVVHSFVGESESELSLKEGEAVNVLDKTDDWWVGEKNGIVGHFPPSFVKLLPKPTENVAEVKSDEAEAAAPQTTDTQSTHSTPSPSSASPQSSVVGESVDKKEETGTPSETTAPTPTPDVAESKETTTTPAAESPTTANDEPLKVAVAESTKEATDDASPTTTTSTATSPATASTSTAAAPVESTPATPSSPITSPPVTPASPPAARLDTPFYTTSNHISDASQAIPISPTAVSSNGVKSAFFTPAIAPSRSDVPPERPFGSPPEAIRAHAFKLTRAATANQLGKSPVIGSRRPPSPPAPATAPPPTRTTSLFTLPPPRKPTTPCPPKPTQPSATEESAPVTPESTTPPTTTTAPTEPAPSTTPTTTPTHTAETPQGPRENFVAVWDYEPETDAELRFKAGDVIVVFKTEDDGEWYQGEFNGKVGHFPKTYVRSQAESSEAPVSNGESSFLLQIGTIAQVLYDYKPLTDTELPLTKGDEVVVLEKQMKGGWSKVSHNGRVGHVPSTYLNFTDEVYPPTKLTSIGKGKAVWTFEAQSDSELSFKKGDEISILKKLNGSWWLGELNGVVGHFPNTYVQEEPFTDSPTAEKEPQTPSPRQHPSTSVSEKHAPVVQSVLEAVTLAQISSLIEKATQPLLQEITKLNEALTTERKAREELQQEVTKLREKQTEAPPATSPVSAPTEAIALSPRASDSDSMGSIWRRELEATVNKLVDEFGQLKRKVEKMPDSSKPEVPFKPSSLRSTGSKLY